jgi:hypothetical protein
VSATRQFIEVPPEAISPAGWICPHCRTAVEKFAQAFPQFGRRGPRMIILACNCRAGVAFFENDWKAIKAWKLAAKLRRNSPEVRMVVLDGRKPEPFGGRN